MVRFLSISSGSNGNCYYVGDGCTGVIVDVGIGYRTIKKRLEECDIDIRSVKMVLVTHDHFDHVKGLSAFTDKLSVPVFATTRIHDAIISGKHGAPHLTGCRRIIKTDYRYEHLGVKFIPFEVPHDATQTLGYHIEISGVSFTFMTDLGGITQMALECARHSDYVILESNFDVDMLLSGPYPPELKLRVFGEHGHLSNEQCAGAIVQLYHPDLRGLFLCHLSKENNTPEMAYDCAKRALDSVAGEKSGGVLLKTLPRNEVAAFICEKAV